MNKYRLGSIYAVKLIYSDLSLWRKYQKETPPRGQITTFISLTGNQLLFVLGEVRVADQMVLDSRRLRLEKSQPWTLPLIINCAKKVGIEISGLQHLAATFKQRDEERKVQRLDAIQKRRDALQGKVRAT